jgi:hypothetical protein
MALSRTNARTLTRPHPSIDRTGLLPYTVLTSPPPTTELSHQYRYGGTIPALTDWALIGACRPSVASLAWSLAVAGDARVGGRGVPVLAGVSGISGECFSWMGGGSSAVTGLLLI